MNRLEKDNILQQLENIEQETSLEAVKDLLQYLKRNIESC